MRRAQGWQSGAPLGEQCVSKDCHPERSEGPWFRLRQTRTIRQQLGDLRHKPECLWLIPFP